MPNATKVTAEKKAEFIEALLVDGNVSRSAKSVGVSREHFYRIRRADEEFAKLWEDAVKIGHMAVIELMEEECDRRALKGVDKPVYQGGKLVGQIRHYSDNLLMFRLKRLDPRYARNVFAGDREQPLVLELVSE
ncbi:hypothetical protein OAN24_05185 [Pseudodesulfovibrio sp.]|nr:hypothetical protein [Pseudodesulfovibrio sp.]